MIYQEDSSDEGAVKRRKERTLEFAALFKEAKQGSQRLMEKITNQFMIQEGVSRRKALEYLGSLKGAGLIVITNGHKSWRYEPKAEWDLFKVEI
jgi:hypothetical protein